LAWAETAGRPAGGPEEKPFARARAGLAGRQGALVGGRL